MHPTEAAPADSADPTTEYARQVVAREIVAGPWVRAACERHLSDLVEGPKRGLSWHPELAARKFKFSAALKLAEGEHAGEPFYLELWQCFVEGSIFGWLGPDGYRRFRTAYLEIGKGNGKTPMAADMALYGLTADGESGAEIYCAAVSRQQAGIGFRDVKNFAEKNPALKRRLTILERNIAYEATDSFIRPLSSEGSTLDGLRVHMGILDEVHAHPTPVVVEKISAGVKGRRQPLIINITNSGVDPASICGQLHDYAVDVLTGVIEDDTFFAYVCALDVCEVHKAKGMTRPETGCADCDDWMNDKACWIKANPNLGVSIQESYLENQVRQARGMPAKQNLVARLNFCVWTDSVSAWIGRDQWEAVQADFDEAELAGRPCGAALDLSSRKDLTAGVLYFASDAGIGDVLSEFWAPEEGVEEREKKDRAPYSAWCRSGFLTLTPGATVDLAFVANRIAEWRRTYDLRWLAYDRWGFNQLIKCLAEIGIEARELEAEKEPDDSGVLWIIPFGQGFKDMSPAVQEIERLTLNKKFRVKTNPVLTWNAASARLISDAAGNRKFTKQKATGRIDGIVALAMATGVALGRQEPQEHDWSGFISSPVIG